MANEENVPEWRRQEFEAVKGENLKTSRAWAIKEALRQFWTFDDRPAAADYYRRWYFWATHSRLAPVISAAKTLQAHLANILTYFQHRVTNATAEGLNSKIQMVKEMACGFRNREPTRPPSTFTVEALISTPDWNRQPEKKGRPLHMVVTHSIPGSGHIL